MKAIIIPLNKYFFNFEKYDGMTAPERYIKKHPGLFDFLHSKNGERIFVIFIAIPIAIPCMLFYFGPIYLFYFILNGKKKAFKMTSLFIDKMEAYFDKKEFAQRRNLLQEIISFKKDGYKIFVYYSSEMIPRRKRRRKQFFIRLEKMKKKLSIYHIHQADTKEEIDLMIWLFDIDFDDYFLATTLLEYSKPELLVPHSD